jgi:hypothetical protein
VQSVFPCLRLLRWQGLWKGVVAQIPPRDECLSVVENF